MSSTKAASNTTAPTQFLQVNGHSYAYRRFGNGSGLPLLCLQHFTGTLDNWDSAVTIRSPPEGRSSCSTTLAWGVPPATSRGRSPEWRDTRWPFLTDLE